MDEYKELKPREKPNISNMESFSQNISNFREIKADNFEDNLNISDIMEENRKMQQKENSQSKNYINSNIYKDINIKDDFSEDLDNIKEDEFNQRKISLCSMQSEEFNYNDLNNINNLNNKKTFLIEKKETKKITKEDLNNIPLPVFSCIYCSNDIIAFRHLIQEIITNKYLFQTSVYDIRDINKLIICQPIIDKDDKNEKLLNIIIKNTEYIQTNYTYEKIKTFFKSKIFNELCQKELMNNKKYFTQRIEESIVKKKKDFYFKGINKIPKNSLNNRCLFNSTNSLINNYNSLSGFVETIPTNNNINIGKNNNTNNSNISINFNSISLNNNETGNYTVKDNNNLLVSIVEHIENNIECANEIDDKEEIMDFFDLDIKRKITKENIIWENNYYDIWNPVISDDDIEENNDFSSSIKNELGISRRNKYIKRKKIYKFKKNNLSNMKSNEFHHEKDYTSELSEKDYKLKVNLLKSTSKLKSKTSNNSFNYKANKVLSVSQMKSMGSTNNSTVINYDNNEKLIKSNIISHIRDFNTINNTKNESRIAIYVNTLNMGDILQKSEHKNKKNNSINISETTSLKSKNILNQTLNNQFKIYSSFINSSSIFNLNKSKYKSKNVINKKGLNSNSTSFNKSNNNLSISKLMNKSKFMKNNSKIEKLGKNKKILDAKKNRSKDTSRKLNTFNTLNSYLSNTNNHKNNQSKNNITSMNKTISNTNNNASNNISLNGRNKIISTRIIFKKKYNNKLNFITNNNCKKTIQFKTINHKNNNNNSNSKKYNLSYCSFNKNTEKISIEKIRKKIAEISKIINNKNLKGYHLKNKANTNITGLFNTIQIGKTNKNRNKAELFPKNNGNNSNTNNKLNSERKSFLNSNKKLMLSSSFVNKPKIRIVDKNNIKRFINFNK